MQNPNLNPNLNSSPNVNANDISITKLETILRKHINKAAVDQALLDYKTWSSKLTEDKKEVAHLLYFLKTVEQRSGDKTLKKINQISHLILSKAETPNLDRRQNEEQSYLTLLRKQIGSKYQIDMEFENPNKGSKVTKSIPDLTM